MRDKGDTMKKQLMELYLDYFNDYLTIEKMAEHRDMDVELLRNMVDEGRGYYNEHLDEFNNALHSYLTE